MGQSLIFDEFGVFIVNRDLLDLWDSVCFYCCFCVSLGS